MRRATVLNSIMFGLDPQSIVARVNASGEPPPVPTQGGSLVRGTVGFTLVSLGGFAPWMLAGPGFNRAVGELGLYAVCALVFVILSGPLLHRLIVGPGSLGRFYRVFTLAFLAYAVAWTVGWMTLGGHPGSIVGLLAGAIAMGLFLSFAFAARGVAVKVITALFVANTVGYFIGGWAYGGLRAGADFNLLGIAFDRSAQAMLAKAAWGLFYGLGFGAGIGFAFHVCQAEARRLLVGLNRSSESSPADPQPPVT
ncbi:MAG: hypothetical protein IH623_14980 [Verrucomicrobia bacterium]|nr:hypothetical protein [Verrucomicrobiota bacterium]